MRLPRITMAVPFALALAATAGCSTNAWYQAMKFHAENECSRQPPDERQRCLSRLNTMTYDDYERQRSRSSN